MAPKPRVCLHSHRRRCGRSRRRETDDALPVAMTWAANRNKSTVIRAICRAIFQRSAGRYLINRLNLTPPLPGSRPCARRHRLHRPHADRPGLSRRLQRHPGRRRWPATRSPRRCKRAGVDPGEIDDVILGAALQQGSQGFNVARQSALRAGLPDSVAGDVDRPAMLVGHDGDRHRGEGDHRTTACRSRSAAGSSRSRWCRTTR